MADDLESPAFIINLDLRKRDKIMIYALRDGARTHVLDAVKNETFSCENCHDRVTPRQGNVNPWHFVHAKNPDCITDDRKEKGCVFQLPDNRNMKCKTIDECEQECPFKEG